MNNYSATFSILGYSFKVMTRSDRLLEEQIRYIESSCITNPVEEDKENKEIVEVRYIEDYRLFYTIRKTFDEKKAEVIQSFENVFHLKYEMNGKEYFCQLGNEWILIKNNEKSFIIIGNGINETTEYPLKLIRYIIAKKEER